MLQAAQYAMLSGKDIVLKEEEPQWASLVTSVANPTELARQQQQARMVCVECDLLYPAAVLLFFPGRLIDWFFITNPI